MTMKIFTEMRFSKLYSVGITVYSEGALTTFFIKFMEDVPEKEP